MFEKKITRKVIYVIFAFFGAILIFLNTWNYGCGLTDDSINYIYSGSNLLALNGFYNYDSTIFINWPPLYSVIIFVISRFGSNIYWSMTIFNTVLYMFTILLLGRLSENIFTTPRMKVLYTATLTFSYQLLFIYTKVFSETIFISLIVITVLQFQQKKVNTGNGFMVLLLALCVLTRYLGLAIVITYFLYKTVLDVNKIDGKKYSFLKPTLYSLLAVIPVSIWFVRNWHLTSNITSLIFNSQESILENIYQLLYSTSAMFIPESLNTNLRISIFIFVITTIIILYFKLKIKLRDNIFFVLFCLSYICLLIILSTFLKFDKISFRFIIPLYFILQIYIFYFFEYLIKYSKKKSIRALIWIIFLLIIIFPVEKGIKHTFINYSNGIDDFHSKKWKESETVMYIKKDLKHSNIYSNNMAGIYANTGILTNRISNYLKTNYGNKETVQIIFNNTLPGIDTIPNLISNTSIGDSVIYLNDSYIIIKKY